MNKKLNKLAIINLIPNIAFCGMYIVITTVAIVLNEIIKPWLVDNFDSYLVSAFSIVSLIMLVTLAAYVVFWTKKDNLKCYFSLTLNVAMITIGNALASLNIVDMPIDVYNTIFLDKIFTLYGIIITLYLMINKKRLIKVENQDSEK